MGENVVAACNEELQTGTGTQRGKLAELQVDRVRKGVNLFIRVRQQAELNSLADTVAVDR